MKLRKVDWKLFDQSYDTSVIPETKDKGLPSYKWPVIWYMDHIQKGDYYLVYTHEYNKYAINIKSKHVVVSKWMTKEKIIHYLQINYGVTHE